MTTEKERAKSRAQLIRLMEKHDLSCPEVAELVSVRPQTVRTWRAGRAPVPQYVFTIFELTYKPAA